MSRLAFSLGDSLNFSLPCESTLLSLRKERPLECGRGRFDDVGVSVVWSIDMMAVDGEQVLYYLSSLGDLAGAQQTKRW